MLLFFYGLYKRNDALFLRISFQLAAKNFCVLLFLPFLVSSHNAHILLYSLPCLHVTGIMKVFHMAQSKKNIKIMQSEVKTASYIVFSVVFYISCVECKTVYTKCVFTDESVVNGGFPLDSTSTAVKSIARPFTLFCVVKNFKNAL